MSARHPSFLRIPVARAVLARPLAALTLLATLACLSGACRSRITPAEATCAGACNAVPPCPQSEPDVAGCIQSCTDAASMCVSESLSAAFRDNLACLENATYKCVDISKADSIPITTDCGGVWAGETKLPFGCGDGAAGRP